LRKSPRHQHSPNWTLWNIRSDQSGFAPENFHDLAPLLGFLGNEFSKVGGRAWNGMIIGGMNMQLFFLAIVLMVGTWLAAFPSPAQAAPCFLVTLTGTMSGPVLLNGVAGAGTLLRYGDDSSDCSAVKLQFDAGRGTALRLSQVNADVGQLDAIFFTHMHSDHTEGFADLMQARWNWNSAGQSSMWSAARMHRHRSASP
jgi:Metallo-beta-lactamase superfamily